MYRDDILSEAEQQRMKPAYRQLTAQIGLIVEDRSTGFCGDVVKISSEAVTLRDRKGDHRHFRYKPGGFLYEGKVVSLVRAAQVIKAAAPRVTNSGSIAAPGAPVARVARASRIWVEGKHDAELVEHVWGDDLRDLGIVVEPMHGIDHLVEVVQEFQPGKGRTLGILVDHLVPGSKEQRIADRVHAAVGREHVMITGHPFVDVWEGIWPRVIGIQAWPTVPRDVEWKAGMCAALGTELHTFWPQLRNRVNSFADLRPELVGAVERLIDFVAPTD